MKKTLHAVYIFSIALWGCALMLFMFATVAEAADVPKAEMPAVITSLGQSPDAYTVSVLSKRAGLTLDYENLIKPDQIAKYKTVLMAVGASLKGFGSAGVNLDTELDRGKQMFETAKANKTFLVVMHTGGEGRREQMTNKLLDVVAGQANLLIVLEGSNLDNYFTNLSKDKQISLIVVKNILDIQNILKEMFSKP